jgi:hypothetical protein
MHSWYILGSINLQLWCAYDNTPTQSTFGKGQLIHIILCNLHRLLFNAELGVWLKLDRSFCRGKHVYV